MSDQDHIHDHEELNCDVPQTRKYPWYKLLLCYGTALLVSLFILHLVVAPGISEILSYLMEREFSKKEIIGYIGGIFLILYMAKYFGDSWRANELQEIGTAVTNFRNPFYDPNFEKGPFRLQVKYNELFTQFNVQRSLLQKAMEQNNEYAELLQRTESKLRVQLRHHDNANRIIDSLIYLTKINHGDIVNRMLKDTLEECITVLHRDLSDKSISLFEVVEEKLKIREYVRIGAESAYKRSFAKGQGFAGYVWKKGEPVIKNNIDYEEDEMFKGVNKPNHEFYSIMGLPLVVDGQTYGVLCLQSESKEGFSEEDLKAVQFYSNICTYLLLCDKIEMMEVRKGADIQ
jgi:putative methionine-R-sulfoxide reductase with GAF domain